MNNKLDELLFDNSPILDTIHDEVETYFPEFLSPKIQTEEEIIEEESVDYYKAKITALKHKV
jgi:hypothetical protein